MNLKAGTIRLSQPYSGQTGLKNKAMCGFSVGDRPPERPTRQEKQLANGKSPEDIWTGPRSQLDGVTRGHGRRETLGPALKGNVSCMSCTQLRAATSGVLEVCDICETFSPQKKTQR